MMDADFLSFFVSQQRNVGVMKTKHLADRLNPYMKCLLPFSRKGAYTDRNFQSTEVVRDVFCLQGMLSILCRE